MVDAESHHDPSAQQNRFRCPFCEAYEVERLFLGAGRIDSCECRSCAARWDEDALTGAYLGRSGRESVVLPRD